MNDETLAKANKLKKAIEHYKWQLKYVDGLAESNVEITISTKNGKCNIVEVPDEHAKQCILEYIGTKYTILLSEAEKEFEEL